MSGGTEGGGAPAGRGAAAARLAAFAPEAAVVFGSGLAALPAGARVEAELAYADLGWPVTAVAGHRNVLGLVRLPLAGAGGEARELRLAVACGRGHRYEGFTAEELGRPLVDLAAAGARRFVLTNSCGGLRPAAAPGRLVVCHTVADLQQPPPGPEPPRLAVCPPPAAAALAAALAAAGVAAVPGTYVAVPGPQFETPAEARWLAGYGEVVGMSGAPEVRAALALGVDCCLLAAVANRSGAPLSHDDVLAAGAGLAAALARALPLALARATA